MQFLHSDIGSSKDNARSPIHTWYKFTAGFSHRFVDEIIVMENLKNKAKDNTNSLYNNNQVNNNKEDIYYESKLDTNPSLNNNINRYIK